MYRTWTRRRTTATPPRPGARVALLCTATVLAASFLPGCGGKDKVENRIKPIVASLTMTAFSGAPDPAVFLEEVSRTGDLVVVDVKLHNTTGAPIDFDAFTLEFTYDFRLIQVGDLFQINPALLGDCNAGTPCDPLCSSNAAGANDGLTVDANGKTHFLMGIAAKAGCPTASVNSDTTLLTLGFIATTTIAGPPGPAFDPDQAPGRIALISGAGRGDCEILSGLTDLGISCVDGKAFLTASN